MAKVAGIVDSEFKTGISAKTNKPWKIMKIELEDGTTATGFDTVEVGDEVDVTKNDYGLQYKALKKAPGGNNNDDVSKMLNMMYKLVQENNSMLKQLLGSTPVEEFPSDQS